MHNLYSNGYIKFLMFYCNITVSIYNCASVGELL